MEFLRTNKKVIIGLILVSFIVMFLFPIIVAMLGS